MSKFYTYPCSDSTTCHPITVSLTRGRYLIECFGAQGGNGLIDSEPLYRGGRGAYASGVLDLRKTTTLYLYIGGKGQNGPNNHADIAYGGWNGGGNSGRDSDPSNDVPDTSGAGGGSTDVRLIKATAEDESEVTTNDEESTNEESLDSRIIVAAGGSGSVYNVYGAPGGDLTGYKTSKSLEESFVEAEMSEDLKGKGEDGENNSHPSSGAGGGYFGGKKGISSSSDTTDYLAVSSSGSSYVAGFPDCPKFPNEELGSVFGNRLTNPQIFNGFSVFPSFEGNGAIKITKLGICSVCNEKRREIILFAVVFVLANSRKKK